VPFKNIKFLDGRPLIEYSIRAAHTSGLVTRYFVSTECDKIKGVAVLAGAEVDPRPVELAGDTVGVDSVIMEFLRRRQDQEVLPEFLALLQPTSPFVSAKTIDKCMKALALDKEADSVQSICPVTHHNHAINQRHLEKDRILFAFPEQRMDTRRKQDKREHFSLGNFIGMRVKSFLDIGTVYGNKSIVGDVVNRYEAIDVDTFEDFEQAELYLQAGKVPKVQA
jgi:CMP-N,N'-diacetyllegionaminic acid synthase